MSAKKSIARIFSFLFCMVFILAVAPSQLVEAAGVRYVKPVANGSGACSNWENACTLQTALAGADSGDEIWVAAGIYKPTIDPTNRNATFQLKDGVAIYGGFDGAETARNQRDPQANLTILSGDIDGNDSQTPIITNITSVTGNTTNSYHVVTDGTGAILDGFSITAGNANGASPNDTGGGLLNTLNGSRLSNITFRGNSAVNVGGGIYNFECSPTLTNVTFSNNFASNAGGGMFNDTSNNTTFKNVTFANNSATTYAGGLFNWDSNNTTITNVTFSGNTTNSYGGAMANRTSSPTLTNVTFSGNSAGSYGGGIFNVTNSSPPIIRNTIFWGNTAPNGAQIYNWDGSTSVSDSVVQGGYAGTNILTTDPMLGTLGDYGGFTQTIPLLAGSSAINTGNDSICPATDQRGVLRPQGEHCDIGAYEVQIVLMAIPGGKTSGPCQSWEDACELRYALNIATSGQEIWVAAGTYKPTAGTERNATFQLKNGVGLYGGFAGTETARSQRNPTANPTTLSGDLNGDDAGFTNNSENVYHVVTGATGATLDGFTITAGNANVADVMDPDGNGGGMLNNSSSSPTLTNLIFSGNSTAYYGGGILNWNSSNPTLTNVSFNGNLAGSDGGGMFNWNSSSPMLTNVTFSGNSAQVGGGMYNYLSSNPALTNVTFSNNSATTLNGGGMYNHSSSPTLTNLTFSGNSATNYGGGMYNEVGSNPQIRNTIFWGNTAASAAQIYNSGSAPVVSYSVVQGGYAGTDILTADPLLGTLGDYGGITQTIPLLVGSSAIDTGNDTVCPATDQRGVTRPQGKHCDIGAYEANIFWLHLPLVIRY